MKSNHILSITFLLFFITYQSLSQSNRIDYDKHVKKGEKLFKERQLKEAMLEFIQAVAIDSSRIEAHYGLGVTMSQVCYSSEKFCSQSIKHLKKVISLEANYKNAFFNKAICENILGNYENAISDYTEALKLKPKDTDIYINRAAIYFFINDSTKACADINAALDLNKKLPVKPCK